MVKITAFPRIAQQARFNQEVAELYIYKYGLNSGIQETLASFIETAVDMLSLKLSCVKGNTQ